jgi:hypothetical protein
MTDPGHDTNEPRDPVVDPDDPRWEALAAGKLSGTEAEHLRTLDPIMYEMCRPCSPEEKRRLYERIRDRLRREKDAEDHGKTRRSDGLDLFRSTALLRLASTLLDQASSEYANRGCTDYSLSSDLTDADLEVLVRLIARGTDEPPTVAQLRRNAHDFQIMSALASGLKERADEIDDRHRDDADPIIAAFRHAPIMPEAEAAKLRALVADMEPDPDPTVDLAKRLRRAWVRSTTWINETEHRRKGWIRVAQMALSLAYPRADPLHLAPGWEGPSHYPAGSVADIIHAARRLTAYVFGPRDPYRSPIAGLAELCAAVEAGKRKDADPATDEANTADMVLPPGSSDPHGAVAIGWHCRTHGYTVMGFAAPNGTAAHDLMVEIKYDGGGRTTRHYASVLVDVVKAQCSTG